MPENKPRENEFLKQNQAAQFVKSSSDILQRKIGSVFNNTAKAFNDNAQLQVENTSTLKRIDANISILNKNLIMQTKILAKAGGGGGVKATTARDLVRKADPDDGMRKNIGDMETLLKEIRDNDERDRKKKRGMFGLLGGLAMGGLAGYLLTGKGEMITELMDKFKAGISTVMGGITDWYKNKGGKEFVGDMGNIIGTGFKKATTFALKTMWEHKGATAMGGLLGLLLTGNAGALVATMGIAGNALTKMISLAIANPVTAGLIGATIFTATNLWKLGDAIAGGIEAREESKRVREGVADSMIESATVRADRLNLSEEDRNLFIENQKTLNTLADTQGTDKFNEVQWIFSKYSTLPFMKEWQEKSKNGKFTKQQKRAIVDDALSYYRNEQTNTIRKATSRLGVTKNNQIMNPTTITGGDMNTQTTSSSGSQTSTISSFADQSDGSTLPYKDYNGIRLYKKYNPNLDGLQPDMLNNFTAMSEEYFNATGDTIQVNSAKRSGGGRSSHNHGWAIDINSKDANKLDEMGLLNRYKFHRPLLKWKTQNEPWHLEPYPGKAVYGPRDTINNNYRIKALMGGKPQKLTPEEPQIGGGGLDVNMPQGTVERRYEKNAPVQVVLAGDDIDKLAYALGEQLRKNRPQAAPLGNNQVVSGRKF